MEADRSRTPSPASLADTAEQEGPSEASRALLAGALDEVPAGAEALRLRVTAHAQGEQTDELLVVALLHGDGSGDLAAEHRSDDSTNTWGYPLDSADVADLRQATRSDGWWSNRGPERAASEGERWEIEHGRAGEFRRLTRWNPEDDDEFMALGDLLLDCAGVATDEFEGTVFDRDSEICHQALEQLREVLLSIGFKVHKKHEDEATIRVYLPDHKYPLLNPRFHPDGRRFGTTFVECLVTSVWHRDGAQRALDVRLQQFPGSGDVMFQKPDRETVNRGIRHLGWFVMPLSGGDSVQAMLESVGAPLAKMHDFLTRAAEESPQATSGDEA